MPDRSVSASLDLKVSGYVAGLNTARRATTGFIGELEKTSAKRQALSKIGDDFGKIGLAAGAAGAAFIVTAANFDEAMSHVQAATHESTGNMELLRAAALKAGADTAFSASEAAGGIEELAKAGVSTAAVLSGGLSGALNLAAAGGQSVAESAEIAASALKQFGLSGKDVPHVADLLAAAAGKAQGSVSDMGFALKYAGVPAHALGVSIEETTGTLAEFASAGIVGEQAGTNLRSIMLSLAAPTKIAREEMEKYGLQLYDEQGHFVGLKDAAQQLHDKLGDASEAERNHALSVIFGQNAIQGAITLYNGGGQAVDKWTKSVDDSGYAAQTAAIRMDNLKGDVEQLKGALETALIGTGEDAQGPLRSLVGSLTDVVNAYNKLPGPVKNAVGATTGFVAVAGGGVFVATKMVGAISDASKAFHDLGIKTGEANKKLIAAKVGVGVLGAGLLTLGATVSDTDRAMGGLLEVAGGAAMGFAVGGPWGAGVGGGISLLTSLAGASGDAAGEMAALTATLDQQTGAITDNTRKWAAKQLADAGVLDGAKALGLNLSDVTTAATEGGDALSTLLDTLDQIAAAGTSSTGQGAVYTSAAKSAMDLHDKLMSLSGSVQKSQAGQRLLAEAAKKSGGAMKSAGAAGVNAAGGVAKAGDAADGATPKVQSLSDAFKVLSGWLDRRAALRNYQDAIDAFTQSIKDNGKSFDINSEKGRENQARLDAIADSAVQVASGLNRADKIGFMRESADRIRQIAADMDLPKAAVQAIIAKLTELGQQRPKPKVTADTASALAKIDSVLHALGLLRDKDITVTTFHKDVHIGPSVGGHGGKSTDGAASGGHITGPGTATSDSIPAWLSNGEYVVRAAAVDKYGVGMFHMLNAMAYASGGPVGKAPGAYIDDRELPALRGQVKHEGEKSRDQAEKHHKQDLEQRKKQLDELKQLRSDERDYARQVTGNFRTDPFENNFTLQGVVSSLQADTRGARDFTSDARRARRLGLSGPVLEALLASGNGAVLDQVDDRGDVRALEQAWRNRNAATQQLAGVAGNAWLDRHGRKQAHTVDQLNGTIDRLHRQIRHLRQDVRDGSREGTREGTADGNRRLTRRRAMKIGTAVRP